MLVRLIAAVALVAAGPAAAVSFFSIGGAPDPGLASFESLLVSFDSPHAPGIVQTNTGTVGLFTGSTGGVAAAPAGETSQYLAIGDGGSATFDFRSFFASQMRQLRSLSVYVGSVDTYNYIDVLDNNLNTLTTITGTDLPGNNGDQGAAITNRRLYINFLPSEQVGGLRFRSTGVAFEFDTIGASSAIFNTGGNPTPPILPPATGVPEPTTWAMLLAGFGMVGFAARRRPRQIAA
ncbi:MAG: PEPxxWA-CTERM sorting domain-containing protein [Polymorphobacter sp.]